MCSDISLCKEKYLLLVILRVLLLFGKLWGVVLKLNGLRVALWPRNDLSWGIFYVLLRRMCFLVSLDGMFCIYLLCYFSEVLLQVRVFPVIFRLDDLSDIYKWLLKCPTINFLLFLHLILLIFALNIYMLQCWVHIYIYTWNSVLIIWHFNHCIATFFVSCDSFWLKICIL